MGTSYLNFNRTAITIVFTVANSRCHMLSSVFYTIAHAQAYPTYSGGVQRSCFARKVASAVASITTRNSNMVYCTCMVNMAHYTQYLPNTLPTHFVICLLKSFLHSLISIPSWCCGTFTGDGVVIAVSAKDFSIDTLPLLGAFRYCNTMFSATRLWPMRFSPFNSFSQV